QPPMPGRLCLFNVHHRGEPGVLRKTLPPQDPREKRARRYLHVRLKANDITEANDVASMMSGSVVIQYLLKMPACAGLVADIVLGHAHVVLAEQPIVLVLHA